MVVLFARLRWLGALYLGHFEQRNFWKLLEVCSERLNKFDWCFGFSNKIGLMVLVSPFLQAWKFQEQFLLLTTPTINSDALYDVLYWPQRPAYQTLFTKQCFVSFICSKCFQIMPVRNGSLISLNDALNNLQQAACSNRLLVRVAARSMREVLVLQEPKYPNIRKRRFQSKNRFQF